jgi:hypothetical protein
MEQNDESTLKRETQEHIIAHLERMSVEFKSYFPLLTAVSDRSTDCICSPLSIDADSKANLSGNNQDHLVEIMSDHRFQRSFKEKSLSQFWMEVKNECPEVGNVVVTALLPLGSTYLCEKTLSAKVVIKRKQRNCLQVEPDLALAVSNVSPRIEELMNGKKAHVSYRKRHFTIFIIASMLILNFGLGILYTE